jgi:hypothetical protein
MALDVDWAGSRVIFVPRADMPIIQSSPEIRELDVYQFHLDLRTIETVVEGRPWPETHVHEAATLLAGTIYAPKVRILPPYTVTFEDGQYAVNLTGANNNLADVTNVNQVSLRSNNSAGLVVSSATTIAPTQQEIRDAMKIAPSGGAPAAGSVDDQLGNLAVPPSCHLSVAYDSTANTLDMVAWLKRGNAIVTAPTALTIVFRTMAGATLFTVTQADATLLATGHYAVADWPQALSSNTSYQAAVTITDAAGSVTTQRSVVTS